MIVRMVSYLMVGVGRVRSGRTTTTVPSVCPSVVLPDARRVMRLLAVGLADVCRSFVLLLL